MPEQIVIPILFIICLFRLWKSLLDVRHVVFELILQQFLKIWLEKHPHYKQTRLVLHFCL